VKGSVLRELRGFVHFVEAGSAIVTPCSMTAAAMIAIN
jgi:hypothetical protein